MNVTDRIYSEPLPKFSIIIKGKPKFLALFLWNICPFWRSGKKASQWGTRIQISLCNAVTKYFIIGRIPTFAFAVFANYTIRNQWGSRLNWKPSFAETKVLKTKEITRKDEGKINNYFDNIIYYNTEKLIALVLKLRILTCSSFIQRKVDSF